MAKEIGLVMADCLGEHGFFPRIAAPSSRWSIRFTRQEEIFREELDCRAVLAINTDESYDKVKFWDEIDLAKYQAKPPIPVVAFLCKEGRVVRLLLTGCREVWFDPDRHLDVCDEVTKAVKEEITLADSAKEVVESSQLPREDLV